MTPPRDTLDYPLAAEPELGATVDVVPGVRWLRLPLPFMLGHINVWLLRDGDGWLLVDSGIFTQTTREVWRRVLAECLDGLPLNRVLVTHLHPDHVGCAGWLVQEAGVELWMSRTEYLLCRVLVADTGQAAPPEGVRFYRAAGFPDEAMQRYGEHFGAFGRVVAPLPQSHRRLEHGQQLQIGSRSWEIIVGRGHSPEHACLYCSELNLLISGDQLLPTISSNVSVYPTEPAANPLADWFGSLRHLREALPEDVLVLPAHGKPFRGAHLRLQQLVEEHETGLARLQALCVEPRRAIDVFPALFRARIDERNLIMAAGEAVSHLNFLLADGQLTVARDENGVDWYQTFG